MPFKSKAQQRYFYANRKKLKAQGVDVDEWSAKTDYDKLPEKVKQAALSLDINIGDTLLGGRFKNIPMQVEELGTDELGQPTVNGRKLLSYRIRKLMPTKKASDDALDDVQNPELRKQLIKALKDYEKIPDPSHGRPHVENVVRAVRRLSKGQNLSTDSLLAAAVLHDIGNLSGDRKNHAVVGARMARPYLTELPTSDRRAILHAIRQHRYTSGKPRTTLAKIVNDADTVSDFDSKDPDYFFRRLIEYRKAHGAPPDTAYTEARQYASDWLDKALNGQLRRSQTLEEYGPNLLSAKEVSDDPEKWRQLVEPMIAQEYGLPSFKAAAEGEDDSFLWTEEEHRGSRDPSDVLWGFPCPRVFVKKSDIQGQGLHCTWTTKKGQVLAIACLVAGNRLYRTPAGRFINHSQKPNSRLEFIGPVGFLRAVRGVRPGQEITMDYRTLKQAQAVDWQRVEEGEGEAADKVELLKAFARRHPQQFKSELQKGMEIEKEHSPKPEVRQDISLDHMTEGPEYYQRLQEMEEQMPEHEPELKKLAAALGITVEKQAGVWSSTVGRLYNKLFPRLPADHLPLKNRLRAVFTLPGTPLHQELAASSRTSALQDMMQKSRQTLDTLQQDTSRSPQAVALLRRKERQLQRLTKRHEQQLKSNMKELQRFRRRAQVGGGLAVGGLATGGGLLYANRPPPPPPPPPPPRHWIDRILDLQPKQEKQAFSSGLLGGAARLVGGTLANTYKTLRGGASLLRGGLSLGADAAKYTRRGLRAGLDFASRATGNARARNTAQIYAVLNQKPTRKHLKELLRASNAYGGARGPSLINPLNWLSPMETFGARLTTRGRTRWLAEQAAANSKAWQRVAGKLSPADRESVLQMLTQSQVKGPGGQLMNIQDSIRKTNPGMLGATAAHMAIWGPMQSRLATGLGFGSQPADAGAQPDVQ